MQKRVGKVDTYGLGLGLANPNPNPKRVGKVDTYAPMSGCFFPLIRSTRHTLVGGGLNGRF